MHHQLGRMAVLPDQDKRFPQVIAHRGYKAAFPENTMAAFRGAVDVGVDGIETDLRLSRDGVVVLSHDASLVRCFGRNARVDGLDWEELSSLRTVRGEPKQSMARLVDLLSYLRETEAEEVWVLLDIKKDGNYAPGELFNALKRDLASTPVRSGSRTWEERVKLGVWDEEWIAACTRYLPDFPIVLLTPSPAFASSMLEQSSAKSLDLHFGLLNYTFAFGHRDRAFLKRARSLKTKEEKPMVFSWSDNDDMWMARSICNGVDGVITDDPGRFKELCSQWDDPWVRKQAETWTLWERIFCVGISMNVWIMEVTSWVMSWISPTDNGLMNVGVYK
ncbi:PLC-like phosphodiesterase [Podospora australis]|uniref:PLC-like phosphodiesterase n=1 Tax=Podospora australis TaxID=1536484 RepID=A0AAN6WQZ8_9PEZI|nr:PLC-like phosphodiesterase [Podospora australis]